MLNKPYQPNSRDAHGRPRIVAFAKWDLAMSEERGRRWPVWHADQPGRECEEFLATLERNRRRVMGEEKHYCMSIQRVLRGGDGLGADRQTWICWIRILITDGAVLVLRW